MHGRDEPAAVEVEKPAQPLIALLRNAAADTADKSLAEPPNEEARRALESDTVRKGLETLFGKMRQVLCAEFMPQRDSDVKELSRKHESRKTRKAQRTRLRSAVRA